MMQGEYVNNLVGKSVTFVTPPSQTSILVAMLMATTAQLKYDAASPALLLGFLSFPPPNWFLFDRKCRLRSITLPHPRAEAGSYRALVRESYQTLVVIDR